jgi:hypothetical protein
MVTLIILTLTGMGYLGLGTNNPKPTPSTVATETAQPTSAKLDSTPETESPTPGIIGIKTETQEPPETTKQLTPPQPPYAPTDYDKDHLSLKEEQKFGTSPRHKTLLVHVRWYTADKPDDWVETQREVKKIFSSFPVDNPDGTTGINLVWTGNTTYRGDKSVDRFATVETWYLKGNLPVKPCSEHLLVVLEKLWIGPNATVPGRAPIGGFVAGLNNLDSIATHTVVHELLHLIVGDLSSGANHPEEGWLSANHEDRFLSNQSLRQIEDGFAISDHMIDWCNIDSD